MKVDRIIRSTRVVTPEGERPAAVLIGDGKIVNVVAHDAVPNDVPLDDWSSLAILPGLVDTHVHCNEPGRTEWEGFETATKSAIAGGVTTIVDMPLNSTPAMIDMGALQDKMAASNGKRYCDMDFWTGLVGNNLAPVSMMVAAGSPGFKAFLCPSGVDDFPPVELADLQYAMPLLAAKGIPLLVHCEIVDNRQSIGSRKYADYLASRPAQFEQAAIAQMIDLCRSTKCHVHVVHLADADSLPMIVAAKQEGLPLTVETCPHYLHFAAEEILDGATEYKCAPPIREASHRERLWQALKDGIIDLVASDHSPCPPEMKGRDRGDFMAAWGGIASLQLGLSVVWTDASMRGITLTEVAQWMSTAPAKLSALLGFKGEIAADRNADLAIFDPEVRWRVEPEKLFHRHKLTPYAGNVLQGRVVATYLRGELAYKDGEGIDDRRPRGNLLWNNVVQPESLHASRGRKQRTVDPFDELNTFDKTANHPNPFEMCCGASRWVATMTSRRPFADVASLHAAADEVWATMDREDILEAFSHHPQIGADLETLHKKYTDTAAWSAGEQAGVQAANEATLHGLVEGNREYLAKFGYLFIVCATGKSAAEMLDLLRARLANDPDTELKIAAAEQAKILHLRIDKLIE